MGVVFALVSAVGYSFSLVLARLSYDYGTNALTIMLIRFSLMVALMLVWHRLRGSTTSVPTRILLVSYLSGVMYFLGIGAYLSSVAYLPVSMAVLLFYTFPLVTALLVALIERRTPHTMVLVPLIAAFVGLGLALGVGTEKASTTGVALGVIAALGVALNMIISARILERLPVTVFSLHMAVSALVCSGLTVAITGNFVLPHAFVGVSVLVLSLICFVIAYLALYMGLPLIGPVRLSMVMNLEPIATIIIAMLLLGETFSSTQALGGCVVILAIVVAQIRPTRGA